MLEPYMYDSVAISMSFTSQPNIGLLLENGCKPFYSHYNGEVYKLVLNGEPGAKEPRLTISKTPKAYWIIKAEVSIGAWMFGSNLFLPNERNMKEFFLTLSDFVRFKTGIKFDAHKGRVTRADATRDFQLGESKVLSVIKLLNNVEIPKYHRKPIDNTGVYFENKGQKKNKKYSIYSKYHDLLNKKASETEIELARGILRFGVEFKNNRAVSNLAKSLRLPNHTAEQILTPEVSEAVIQKAMELLTFESLLNEDDSTLEKLAKRFKKSMALTLAGHLMYKEKFGPDYGEVLDMNLSKNTVRKYDREYAKTVSLSLE